MKKIVGLISILGLTLIGFTNANYQEFDLGLAEEITVNTNLGYSLKLQNDANFITNNQYKLVQFKGNGSYPRLNTIFWSNNGLYLLKSCQGGYDCQNIHTSIKGQGFFNQCGISTLSNVSLSDPNNYPTTNGTTINDCLTNTYSNPNKLYISIQDGEGQVIDFCFGYTELDKIMCFHNNDADNSYLSNSLGFTYNPLISELGGSNDQITTYITNSPFTETIPTPTEPNTISCPTIQQLINTYGTEYNTGLCYSSSLIFSGGTIEQITPKNIFELYPTYTDYIKDVNLYNNYCVGPNTTTACQTAFNNRNIEYTLISKTTETNRAKLYGYCNLQLNYQDKNATTCTTTGTINDNITIEDIINEITNEERNIITPGTPPESEGTGNDTGSGSVFDSLGIGNEEDGEARRNVIAKAQNAIKSMKSIYTKLTGIFRGRTGNNGIIPEYITGLLLVIVLFKIFNKSGKTG